MKSSPLALAAAEQADGENAAVGKAADEVRRARAESRLKAATHSSDVADVELACTEAEAAGVDERLSAPFRMHVRRLHAEANLKAAEHSCDVDETDPSWSRGCRITHIESYQVFCTMMMMMMHPSGSYGFRMTRTELYQYISWTVVRNR